MKEKNLKKCEEEQKKMEELNEFLAKLLSPIRWFCPRTRQTLLSLRVGAPG